MLFVKWLIEKGVDPKSVNFVEVTFPTMNDTLKSGAVDAVLTAEPFVTRIDQGRHRLRRACATPPNSARPNRSSPMSPTRDFAEEAIRSVVKAFRAAIAEAAEIVNGDRDKASESIAQFTKKPLEIVRLNRAERRRSPS